MRAAKTCGGVGRKVTQSGNDQLRPAPFAVSASAPVGIGMFWQAERDILTGTMWQPDSRMSLSMVMNVAHRQHIDVTERWNSYVAACTADSRISQRSDAPVLQAINHRHHLSAQPVGPRVIVTFLLAVFLLMDGQAFAQESLQRDVVRAWPKHGRMAEPSCVSSRSVAGMRCTKHVLARSRAKGNRPVAAARAEANDDSPAMRRRDRPGRYVLHGPRF